MYVAHDCIVSRHSVVVGGTWGRLGCLHGDATSWYLYLMGALHHHILLFYHNETPTLHLLCIFLEGQFITHTAIAM